LKIRLTKRFAEVLNGVDLSRCQLGDVLDVSPKDAGILLAEGWAQPVADAEMLEERRKENRRKSVPMRAQTGRAAAAEKPRRKSRRTR
jgi:hypothetical protein